MVIRGLILVLFGSLSFQDSSLKIGRTAATPGAKRISQTVELIGEARWA